MARGGCRLRQLGIDTLVLSGDTVESARVAAELAGIGGEKVWGKLLPGDKAERVEELRGRGRYVAMVGWFRGFFFFFSPPLKCNEYVYVHMLMRSQIFESKASFTPRITSSFVTTVMIRGLCLCDGVPTPSPEE